MARSKKETQEILEQDVVKKEVTQEDVAIATLETLKAIKEEIKSDKESKEEKASTRRKKVAEIDSNEMIDVRSVTKGGLTYISRKTNIVYTWADYDDVQPMEYGELVTMMASAKVFLQEPCIVIDDEQVAEKLKLTEMYEQMQSMGELDEFFDKSVLEMQDIIKKLPRGCKETLRDKATELVRDGKLYDMRKIKMLEEELKLDLMILID